MRIKEIKVYKFTELSDNAKEHAIEKLCDINVDHAFWYDYEDKKEIASRMGIEIDNIYWSGFSSQGDGACFEGSYEYKKGSVKAVKDYAPIDEELHQIVIALQKVQKEAFYGISANIKHSGHYYHKYCTDISVEMPENIGQEKFTEIEDTIIELLRDYMQWIYGQLKKEYEYQTSEEAIIETINANDYEFTEDGELA